MHDIIISFAPTLITGIILLVVRDYHRKLTEARKKQSREQLMQSIKIDCIIDGLSNVNHNMGAEFKEGFDKSFAQRIEEIKFIESKN